MDNDNPTNQEPIPDPTAAGESPFDHIVDDTEERAEWREWIYREFSAGRDADEILSEVTASGMPVDDAEAMVEEGRRATRHLRGVVTRDEVAQVAEARYRSSIAIASKLANGGLLWMGIHFLLTLTGFFKIPWPRGRRREQENEEPMQK